MPELPEVEVTRRALAPYVEQQTVESVIVPELNLGQLCMLIRARFLVDAVSLSQVKGKPFKVSTLVNKIKEYL